MDSTEAIVNMIEKSCSKLFDTHLERMKEKKSINNESYEQTKVIIKELKAISDPIIRGAGYSESYIIRYIDDKMGNLEEDINGAKDFCIRPNVYKKIETMYSNLEEYFDVSLALFNFKRLQNKAQLGTSEKERATDNRNDYEYRRKLLTEDIREDFYRMVKMVKKEYNID